VIAGKFRQVQLTRKFNDFNDRAHVTARL